MKINTSFLLISLLLIIFSCKPQVPGKYLQPDEFEDILYDYHLADAMVNNDGSDEKKYEVTLYRQAVLKEIRNNSGRVRFFACLLCTAC